MVGRLRCWLNFALLTFAIAALSSQACCPRSRDARHVTRDKHSTAMNCTPLVKRLKRELHWTKLLLRDKDWRSLAFTPWLPYNWWQVVYIIARWIVALYYFAYLVVIFVPLSGYNLIYLTNWGYITWTLYLLVAAVSSTVSFTVWAFKRRQRHLSRQYDVPAVEHNNDAPQDNITSYRGGYDVVTFYGDQLSLFQKFHWVLFTIAVSAQVSAAILFWSLLAPSSSPETLSSFGNLNTHLTGAILAVLDLLVNGITMSIYHMYWSFLYGCSYFLFSVLYYFGGGTDPQGNTSIYPTLDYKNDLDYALGLKFVTNFVFLPCLHVGIYLVCCIRRWLSFHVRSYFSGRGTTPLSRERGDVGLTGTDTARSVHYSSLKTDKESTAV